MLLFDEKDIVMEFENVKELYEYVEDLYYKSTDRIYIYTTLEMALDIGNYLVKGIPELVFEDLDTMFGAENDEDNVYLITIYKGTFDDLSVIDIYSPIKTDIGLPDDMGDCSILIDSDVYEFVGDIADGNYLTFDFVDDEEVYEDAEFEESKDDDGLFTISQSLYFPNGNYLTHSISCSDEEFVKKHISKLLFNIDTLR